MSGKKVNVSYKNKIVEGTKLDFQTNKEEWNGYKLEDGTIMKFKSVVVKVVRTEEYNKFGEPIYIVNSQNMVSASVPKKLMKMSQEGENR